MTESNRATAQVFGVLLEGDSETIRQGIGMLGNLVALRTRTEGPPLDREQIGPPAALPAAEPEPVRDGTPEFLLQRRIEELEAANHGLQDTIVAMGQRLDHAQMESRRLREQLFLREIIPRRNGKTRIIDEKAQVEESAAEDTPAPEPGELIDVTEVCRVARCSKRTITSWRATGKFPPPCLQRGNANFWRKADVDAWLAQQAQSSAAAAAELLDTRAVAQRIGFSQATLYKWISQGTFPPHTGTIGRQHYWTPQVVDAWEAARKKAQETTKPACENCASKAALGRNLFCRCQSKENPNRNKMVTPTDRCDWHSPVSAPYRPSRDEED